MITLARKEALRGIPKHIAKAASSVAKEWQAMGLWKTILEN
jgi:hypothetical protein